MKDCYTPHEALIVEFIDNKPDIFTIRLKLTDPDVANGYTFYPGQFNMIYMYGVGEVAISIVNDKDYTPGFFTHIIQVVGRITKGMVKLKVGDKVGIRGAYGTCWPLELIKRHDIVIATGGLGNAPLMAAVEEILNNRHQYGKLYVLHGIRSSDVLICEDMYERWNNAPDTQVMMATSTANPVDNGKWQWKKGFVTDFIGQLGINFKNTVVLTVGPEIMMKSVADKFIERGLSPDNVFLSLERSMKCAVGHCGHCQLGAEFVCKDGPVYSYSKCKKLLDVRGL